MYVLFADAIYVLLGLVALAIGFGLFTLGLLIEDALSKGLKTLRTHEDAEGIALARRPRSSAPDSPVHQPVRASPAVDRSLRRFPREQMRTL